MRYFITLAIVLVFGFNHAYADQHAVKVTKNDTLGSFLTDTKGMTLYYFKKDAPDKSMCSGDCVTKWPLYYREKVAPEDGLKLEDFGEITREDGKKQSTYKRMPLYYFFKDAKAGDASGQGVNNVWYVVVP